MKKRIKCLFVVFILMIFSILNVKAESNTTYINIGTNKISTDGKSYSDIKQYNSLDDFLSDYNLGKLPDIYLTNFLFDGVSSVKTPDLDDFIENDSNDTKIKTLEINVLNIKTTGNIELTGKAVGFMIAVNTNDIKGEINLILNEVDIDTDTKKAPAIYVYNKETTYTDCKVTIQTKGDTKNLIEGGKFKKVSLMPKEELDDYSSYYSKTALTNYKKYSAYYGIYTKEEIDDILFAVVKADKDGLSDGDPYAFYKGSGAISSDIDLYFEGTGTLVVTSKNKEGIETKGNLVFSGGIGDYEIYAKDDCLNTTTSTASGTNVRNAMIIDVNSLLAVVDDEGDEGDAIDSNGTLTINGGNIYAFAHSSSEDAGIDSETGTFINGGTIIATGNMADAISSTTQNYIYVKFKTKVKSGSLITIKDENENVITAFKTDKYITTLFYSSEDLKYESFKIYSGGSIEGEEVNGLYTNIEIVENGEELSYTTVNSFDVSRINTNGNKFILKLLLGEVVSLSLIIIYLLLSKQTINLES